MTSSAQDEPTSFRLVTSEGTAQPRRLRLTGALHFADAPALWSELKRSRNELRSATAVEIDLSALDTVDGASVALLVHARAWLVQDGASTEFVGARDKVAELLRLYGGTSDVAPRKRRRARSTLDQLGAAAAEMGQETKLALSFMGRLVRACIGVVRAPRTANWADLPQMMERTGADALPIVLLINFLVGLVMAYQASTQLKALGANLLVADLIGISVTRELGPLMTAIVVCGRSGAALAAELGSMRVNEEIDALQTMGLGVLRFIVLPRALALMLVMPLLCLFADFIGMVGGLVVGVTALDLTITGYAHETRKAVALWDVSSGCIKSVIFGLAIALIASQQGLAAEGGAEGVGKRTTSAVVATLFVLILLDATFTVAFRMMDL